jgi:hypothetical protein
MDPNERDSGFDERAEGSLVALPQGPQTDEISKCLGAKSHLGLAVTIRECRTLGGPRHQTNAGSDPFVA